MRTPTDAHRSLQRYIAATLPAFDIWPARDKSNEARPYAVVRAVQLPQLRAGSKQIIDVVQPFAIYLYPDTTDTLVGSMRHKMEVEEVLFQAFFVGPLGPARIPFYDYAGTPDGQPGPTLPTVSATLPDGTPAGYDYLRVDQYQVNSAQDATDEKKWSITLTLRLAWRRHGRLISGTPVSGVSVKPHYAL